MFIMADMANVAISKNKIKVEGDRVVMSLREYRDLLKKSAPTYYLKGKAAERLDKLVEEGLREYKNGKTKVLKSLADLD